MLYDLSRQTTKKDGAVNMNILVSNGELTPEEKNMILERAAEIKGCDHVAVKINGNHLEVYYHIMPFQRIRRITGYLVGTVDRWNNAKRAELKDRVKHGMFDKDEAYDGKP
jgi:hypothetical protein